MGYDMSGEGMSVRAEWKVKDSMREERRERERRVKE
jgi:hypothetical protein